jgi:hypothetical protein
MNRRYRLERAVTRRGSDPRPLATRRCTGPDHVTPRRADDTAPRMPDVCRFLAAILARCGPILLPPRCHEDQKGLTASGDQAPDLHFLVAGAGFEPATSGL